MTWMNTYEIEERRTQYAEHPILGPATATLVNLVVWTNRNSDGWHSWPKPGRAAEKLMDLIQGDRMSRFDDEREDVTEAAYKAALRPIKAFRTRHTADFQIVESQEDERSLREAREIAARRYVVIVGVTGERAQTQEQPSDSFGPFPHDEAMAFAHSVQTTWDRAKAEHGDKAFPYGDPYVDVRWARSDTDAIKAASNWVYNPDHDAAGYYDHLKV